jgi:pimeloyl-ACP methyl ester carboxylesterase
MLTRLCAAALGLSLALPIAAQPAPQRQATVQVATEEFLVPARDDPALKLYVRNKHPADMARFPPDRTVVFVHGATYPAETAFDLPLGGMSWMDFIASRGFDVYLLDVRGYGRSTRPAAMDKPAAESPPVATTDEAVEDVAAVADFVRGRRSLAKLDLLGWSWGTSIMATYAARHPDTVERLVLYAPVWLRTTPSLVQVSGQLGAYRVVSRKDALGRWLTGVAEDRKAALIPAGWFDTWADATFATDPVGAAQNPPVLRAPNGVVLDGRQFWSVDKPMYDPAALTKPVMLTLAEWDHDTPPYMAQTLFPLLTRSPHKRLVMLAEGTHSIIMERNRLDLFQVVQDFLEADFRE